MISTEVVFRFGNKYVGCLVENCVDATVLLTDNNVPEEELAPYLKMGQEIVFRVQSFDANNTFIEGVVDEECLAKMRETIQINDCDGKRTSR